MKVAICFSGLPRNIKDTYNSIYEILLVPNNIEDVFIHTWECEEGEDIGNKWGKYLYDKSSEDYILEKYSPKRYVKEPQEDLKSKSNYLSDALISKYSVGKYTTVFDKQSQFYSLFKSIELISEYQKEHGFVYDMIIKLRFDLMFLFPIIVKDLDPQVLHVSDFGTDGIRSNDWIAIGTYDNIQKYGEVWNNFENLLEQDVEFHPELFVAKNLENYNIKATPSLINGKDHTLYKYFKV